MSVTKDSQVGVGKSTFTWWVTYEYDAEVRHLSIEDLPEGYQSNYLRCWNYVKEKGWIRETNWWFAPDRSVKYKTVFEAYNSQKFREMVEG